MTDLDVITMGRVSVDPYPEQIGATLAEIKTFAKSLGGSTTNVAVAAARLGHRSAVITKVGDVVLEGYHVVSAPPGYDLYYLNVMAGPVREWKINGIGGEDETAIAR